jgi:hypothetical protein
VLIFNAFERLLICSFKLFDLGSTETGAAFDKLKTLIKAQMNKIFFTIYFPFNSVAE